MKKHNNQDITNILIKYKMINYKKLLCHKLANDGGALVMMCEKDEDCFPSITTC